jgi:hypothetical protein
MNTRLHSKNTTSNDSIGQPQPSKPLTGMGSPWLTQNFLAHAHFLANLAGRNSPQVQDYIEHPQAMIIDVRHVTKTLNATITSFVAHTYYENSGGLTLSTLSMTIWQPHGPRLAYSRQDWPHLLFSKLHSHILNQVS